MFNEEYSALQDDIRKCSNELYFAEGRLERLTKDINSYSRVVESYPDGLFEEFLETRKRVANFKLQNCSNRQQQFYIYMCEFYRNEKAIGEMVIGTLQKRSVIQNVIGRLFPQMDEVVGNISQCYIDLEDDIKGCLDAYKYGSRTSVLFFQNEIDAIEKDIEGYLQDFRKLEAYVTDIEAEMHSIILETQQYEKEDNLLVFNFSYNKAMEEFGENSYQYAYIDPDNFEPGEE